MLQAGHDVFVKALTERGFTFSTTLYPAARKLSHRACTDLIMQADALTYATATPEQRDEINIIIAAMERAPDKMAFLLAQVSADEAYRDEDFRKIVKASNIKSSRLVSRFNCAVNDRSEKVIELAQQAAQALSEEYSGLAHWQEVSRREAKRLELLVAIVREIKHRRETGILAAEPENEANLKIFGELFEGLLDLKKYEIESNDFCLQTHRQLLDTIIPQKLEEYKNAPPVMTPLRKAKALAAKCLRLF